MLTLLEPPPAPPDFRKEMGNATRALSRLLATGDDHLCRMIGICGRVAVTAGACTQAEARGIRLVDAPDPPFADLIDEAEAAVGAFLATEWDDPARKCFDLVLPALDHARRRTVTAEIDAQLDRYHARWKACDLPDEPDLRGESRRVLVHAGIWLSSQVTEMTDSELLAIKGIGPKAVKQIRTFYAKENR